MNSLLGIFIILLVFGVGFVGGLGLLFFASRIVEWSERTFSPVINAIAKKSEGKYYQPRSTPSWFLKAGILALRIVGLLFTAASGWVLYTIINSIISRLTS